MTVSEAAAKLGWHPNTLFHYVKRLGFKPTKRERRIRGSTRAAAHKSRRIVHNLTDSDLKAIIAERRRLRQLQSDEKSRLLQRISRKYRAVSKAKRDPADRRAAGLKGTAASAAKRRRIRTWRERHDVLTVEKLRPEFRAHPWRVHSIFPKRKD